MSNGHGKTIKYASNSGIPATNTQTRITSNSVDEDGTQVLRNRIKKRDKENAALKERIAELEQQLLRDNEDAASNLEDAENLSNAMYDTWDGVYRCTECGWEVIDGICEACQMEFICGNDDENEEQPEDTLLIEASYDSDREQGPRSTTPLSSIPRSARPLPAYTQAEYDTLLQRGATRLMIETFHLEFSDERGIFAWADTALYEEFGGPKMLKGDFWKIQLGRRFDLDEDDHDGSMFIEGIVEEAVLFPSGEPAAHWETVEESPGIWVTRIAKPPLKLEDEDEDDYESEDLQEEDDEWGDDDKPVFKAVGVDDGPLCRPGYDTSDDHDSDEDSNDMDVDGETQSSQGDDDVEVHSDPDAAIQANVPDDYYEPEESDSEEANEDQEESASQTAKVEMDDQPMQVKNEENKDETMSTDSGVPTTETDNADNTESMDSDSADSDFDEEETMSGDEAVMNFAPGTLPKSWDWSQNYYLGGTF